MASARNLCQHTDDDGTTCTSNDYVFCPHCQLQLCLKHLNLHQDFLREDCYRLSDQINRVRFQLDHLKFDSSNHRDYLRQQLDQWYDEQLVYLNRIYREKQQQLQVLCLQAQIEFETFKSQKEKEFHQNLSKQWRRVSQQKQIHIDDLNDMKTKLTNIERGLDELQQLLIDLLIDRNTMQVNIVKRRYVEAAKTSFNDDDDHYLWEIDEEEDSVEEKKLSDDFPTEDESSATAKLTRVSSPIPFDSSTLPSCSPLSPTIHVKKAPLKFIIKRLQRPTSRSRKVTYKLQTVPTSSPSLIA